jgi:uncharacterized protein YaaR (DUF327 family)
MKIEDKIDNYLDEEKLDEITAKGIAVSSLKGIGRSVEISFDTVTRIISNILEKSASDTSLSKISKMKYRDGSGKLIPNVDKQLKHLNKKLEYHKIEFIKILSKIDELTGDIENI